MQFRLPYNNKKHKPACSILTHFLTDGITLWKRYYEYNKNLHIFIIIQTFKKNTMGKKTFTHYFPLKKSWLIETNKSGRCLISIRAIEDGKDDL